MRFAAHAAALFVLLSGGSGFAQCAQSCPEHRTIAVSGSGTVTVDADLAIVHVGYRQYAADAKGAYANATETSNAIMKALTGLGIAKTEIESSTQQLQHTPAFELQQNPAEKEFSIAQSWTVRVAPEQSARALDAAIEAGANESGSIDWTLKDPGALRSEAAAKAVVDARRTADTIAKSAGVRVTQVMSVAENDGGGPRPMLRAMAAASGSGFAHAANEPLAINSRRVEVSATVSVVFAIE